MNVALATEGISSNGINLEIEKPPREIVAAFSIGSRLLGKGGYCACFVVLHVEDRIKLCDLQQIVDLLGQIQKLQLSTGISHRGEAGDQLSDARTIDVADISKIEKNALRTLVYELANCVAQGYTAIAQGNASAQVKNGNAVHLAGIEFHAHGTFLLLVSYV